MKNALALVVSLLLLAAGCSGPADFFAAVDHGSVEEIRSLLNSGADPNQRDELYRPALIVAIMKERPEVVELLLKSHADPNSEYEGVAALLFATAQPSCSVQIVGSLLRDGAAPNARERHSGATPLLQAAAFGAVQCVELLIEAGAQVDVENSIHANSVWVAAEGGNRLVLERFLAMHVDPNHASVQNVTPLMVAAAAGHSESVKILMANGVDACVFDVRGRSARDMAVEKGHGELAKLLPLCPRQ